MSSPAKPRKTEAGFTLIEVLVAIALLATISAMVFGSLVTTNRVIETGREQAEREQTARRIMRVMAEDISLSTQSKGFPWVGMNGTQDGQPADTLALLTENDGTGGSAAKETQAIRVVYTRDGDRLMRFTKKNLYGLTDESLAQVELATQVKGFNLRYYDAQSRIWTDDWVAANKAPRALLLEVTFQRPHDEPWVMREWVSIGASS